MIDSPSEIVDSSPCKCRTVESATFLDTPFSLLRPSEGINASLNVRQCECYKLPLQMLRSIPCAGMEHFFGVQKDFLYGLSTWV